MKLHRLISTICPAILSLTAIHGMAAPSSWVGGSTTTNGWSDPLNWSTGLLPGALDSVFFDGAGGATNVQGAVNNVVDQNYTLNDLSFTSLAPNNYGTLIQAGQVLKVNGQGVINNLVVNNAAAGANDQIYTTITGPGSLLVSNIQGSIIVRQYSTSSGSHRATLDLSGLNLFSAVVTNLLEAVGASATEDRPAATILLAKTNFITTGSDTTKPGILVARQTTTDSGATGTLTLGNWNEINTEGLVVAGHRANSGATMSFPSATTGNFLKIRGSSGGTSRATQISLGDDAALETGYTATPTSQSSSGTLNLAGGSVDILAKDLIVGRNVNATSTGTGNTGTGTGTFTYEQGTVDVNNLYIGYKAGANYGNAVGTLNLNGTAVMTVNTNVTLALRAANGTAIPNATINIASGATMNVGGDIIDSGAGVSTINLNGGTINMQPAGDTVAGNITIDNLAGSGTIAGAGTVAVGTNLTLGSLLSSTTLNVGGNLVLSNPVALSFNLANTTTTGAGINDYLNVGGNLALNSNPLQFIPLAPLAVGTYRLLDYTGTKSGSFTFTNVSRYNLTLDQSTPNQVNLVNAGGSPLSLTWYGASSTWDVNTTSNWNNGTEKFYQLDSVTFNDSGLNTNVSLTGSLYPNTVTVNAATNYFFTGTGKLGGGASLTKSGVGMLTVATANDYLGPTVVANGTLKVANGSALGSTNGGTTVSSGATLDVNGTSLYNPGEWITIAGAGLSGTGAVINTGAGQNNALRFLTLSDNATVRSDNRFDVRGPGGNSSFSGVLDLGGFTLTKLGAAQMSIVDSIATNAGSIEIAGGILSLTRSQVSGAGYINISSNVLMLENSSTGYVTKPFSSSGGTLRVTGNAVTLGVPITNVSGLTVDNSVQLTLTNAIAGAGALTKTGAGNLLLTTPNTYAGPTIVSGGTLSLGTSASLPNTPSITVGSGALLDLSALAGGFALTSGQTLSGSGSVVGDVSAGANASVVPGSSAGTLSFSNNLTLNNASTVFDLAADPTQVGGNVNDLVLVASNLTLSGVNTIKIVPLASLTTGAPYTLFQYGTLSGNVANLNVVSDSRYTFTPSINSGTTPPSVQVAVAGNGASATLVWHGGAAANPTVWDTKATTNWLNNGSPDLFYVGDNVTFDDTALTSTITVPATVQPAAVSVNNSTLGYNISGAGALSAGSLAKAGSAPLTFANTADISFSLPVSLNGGSVTFANSGINNFNSGLTLQSGAVTFNSPVANNFNAAAVVQLGTATFADGAINNFNGGLDIQGGTVEFTGTAGNNFGPGITVEAGQLVFNQAVAATVSAPLSNSVPNVAGTVTKQNTNTLTLSGNSTAFDGPIAVNAGVLRTSRGTALGTAVGGTTVANGATLDVNGQNLGSEPVTTGGAGFNGLGAIINTGAGQNNALGSVTLTGDTVFGGTGRWDIRNSPAILSTVNNAYNLTKIGANQVSLVGVTVDPYLANIDVQAGTFDLETTSTAGDPSKTMTIWSGATLEFWNTTTGNPLNKFLVLSNSASVLNGSGANAIASQVTLNGTVTFNVGGTSLELDGPVIGPGGIAKTSGNTLILAGANSYSGGTFISGGTLQVGIGGTAGNLPLQPTGVLTNNGTLLFNRADDVVVTDQITGTGGIAQNGSGAVVLTASNSFAGQISIPQATAPAVSAGIVRLAHSSAAGLSSGSIAIGGNSGGSGRLELSNNIVIADPITVDCRQAGTYDAPAILNISGNNTITATVSGSTGGSEWNVQSDSGKLTILGNFNNTPTSATRHLKLMGAASGEWVGTISNSPGNLSITSLVKTNAGTWTLSGTNQYTGATVISEGTLVLSAAGSISNSTVIDVQQAGTFNVSAVAGFTLASGQTLKGNGQVAGSVAAGANSVVAAGESVGVLTISGPLAFSAGSTNISEIDRLNQTNDLLTASTIAYNGTLVLNEISGASFALGDSFKLFSASSYSGAFAQTVLPALGPTLAWDLSRLATDGTIRVIAGTATTPTNLTWSVSGNTLTLSWPANYLGWSLLMQTNRLATGVSTNELDWSVVPGSASTNRVDLTINPSLPAEFYRMQKP